MSPIQRFSLIMYRSLYLAIRHVRAGRILHEAIFGDQIILGLGVMAVIGVGLLILMHGKLWLQIVR